jgi:hypothetical protein
LSTIDLAFNEKDSKWELKKLVVFDNHEPKPVELGPNEELNSTRLNEMKTALDDLKIVGVRAKPEGLSANLKADKNIFTDSQAIQSLADRGFYAVKGEDGQPEILSSDGDVLVQMQDGVEYTLRFGGVAGVADNTKEGAADKTSKDDATGTEKKGSQGATLNRFIMVSARFNKDLIPSPELEPVPGEESEKSDAADKPEADKADTAKPAQTEKADTKAESKDTPANGETNPSPDKQKSDDTKEPAKENAKAGDDAAASKDADKSAAVDAAEELRFVKLQDETVGAEDAKQAKDEAPKDKAPKNAASKEAASKEAASKNAAAAKTTEPSTSGDAAKADAAKAAAAKTDQQKSTTDSEEDLALRRKQIKTENERKQKEYDEKVEKGEAKAQELNARFAGWYYVVSEDTYRKIHLNREDVIKAKEETKTDGANPNGANANPLKIPPLSTDLSPPPDAATKENGE